MEKRKWEKLGIETSLLGYGCMRFKTIGGECQKEVRHRMSEAIDEILIKDKNSRFSCINCFLWKNIIKYKILLNYLCRKSNKNSDKILSLLYILEFFVVNYLTYQTLYVFHMVFHDDQSHQL